MTTRTQLRTFQDFWPHYLNQHRKAGCRGLHYVGTILASTTLVWAITTATWLAIPVALVVGGPEGRRGGRRAPPRGGRRPP